MVMNNQLIISATPAVVSSSHQPTTRLPLWQCFGRGGGTRGLPIRQSWWIDAALQASCFQTRIMESHPNQASLRDLCRYLAILKYLALQTVDMSPSSASVVPQQGGLMDYIPDTAMQLPNTTLIALLLPALKTNPLVHRHLQHVFYLLTTAEEPHRVLYPIFRSFVRGVVSLVAADACVPPSGSAATYQFLENYDVREAVALGEWRRLRPGQSKSLSFHEWSQWILESAVLLSSTSSHGEHSIRDIVTAFVDVLIPVAAHVTARTTSDDNDASNDPCMEGRGTVNRGAMTVYQHTTVQGQHSHHHRRGHQQAAQSPRLTSSEWIAERFPQLKASHRPTPTLNGTTVGLNDKQSIESMKEVLARGKCASDDLEAKLVHHGAVRMMDSYPLKLLRGASVGI